VKISIVTVSWNSAETIEDTILSVLNQDYQNLEYIVVDGKSTDGTLDIINRYKDGIDTVVSEQDNGLYDALNKGIGLATGDVVGILHSDDVFDSDKVISSVANAFAQSDADAVYGDLVYVDRLCLDRVIRKWVAGTYKQGSFVRGWMPPHPTFFAKKEVFETYGGYNLDFKTAADYELMLRFLEKHQIKCSYIPEVMVRMRAGGTSNATVKNRLRANNEDLMAWQVNGLSPKTYTRYLKPIRKLGQFSFNFYGHKFLLPLLIVIGLFLGSVLSVHETYFELPLKVLLSGFLAWGIAMVTLPPIVNIARIKNLVDKPNHRSSHVAATPTLGGIAVFAATLLGTNLLIENFLADFKVITAAGFIIFFSGIKDDIFALAPNKKFIAQFLAAALVFFAADLKIASLYGIFGVWELNATASFLITVLTVMAITNAINLIDGIDGLASGIGAVASLAFGSWFAYYGYFDYAIFSFTLTGALVAFIKFNFSRVQKIFLGDTGSLIVGFSLSALAIKFILLSEGILGTGGYSNGPLIAFCVLSLPLFDMLRVFFLRLSAQKSPFYPDKNHIHHLLIGRGLSHLQASLLLISTSIVVALFGFFILAPLPTEYFTIVVLGTFVSYYLGCYYLKKSPKGTHRVIITNKVPFLDNFPEPKKEKVLSSNYSD